MVRFIIPTKSKRTFDAPIYSIQIATPRSFCTSMNAGCVKYLLGMLAFAINDRKIANDLGRQRSSGTKTFLLLCPGAAHNRRCLGILLDALFEAVIAAVYQVLDEQV